MASLSPKIKQTPLIIETESRFVKKEYASDLTLKPGKYVVKEYARDKWYKTTKLFVIFHSLDDNNIYKVRAGDRLTNAVNNALGGEKAQFSIDIERSAYIKDSRKTKDLLFSYN